MSLMNASGVSQSVRRREVLWDTSRTIAGALARSGGDYWPCYYTAPTEWCRAGRPDRRLSAGRAAVDREQRASVPGLHPSYRQAPGAAAPGAVSTIHHAMTLRPIAGIQ